jgi:DNA primase
VASLGTALTSQQASLLKRYTDTILLLYDSDSAGKNAAIRAIPILKDEGLTVRVVNQEPYKDPDEFIKALGAEEMEKRLSDAADAILFEIAETAKQYRMDDPQEKTKFLYDAAGRLLRISDEVERENYIEAVAREYHVSPETLRKTMNRLALSGNIPERRQRAGDDEMPIRRKPDKKEDGIVTSEKLMLTYLANHPEAYELTADYIGPADFSDPLCRTIAEGLYEQLEEGGTNEASLISHFQEAEEQRMVAEIFHTTVETRSSDEQDVAFTDTVVRIMNASNDRRIKGWDGKDVAVLRELIARKKKLEEFRGGGKVFRLQYPEENA